MTNFAITGQHLESSCRGYAYRQLHKLEAIAAEINKSGLPINEHPKMAEFVAIHTYLSEVGEV